MAVFTMFPIIIFTLNKKQLLHSFKLTFSVVIIWAKTNSLWKHLKKTGHSFIYTHKYMQHCIMTKDNNRSSDELAITNTLLFPWSIAFDRMCPCLTVINRNSLDFFLLLFVFNTQSVSTKPPVDHKTNSGWRATKGCIQIQRLWCVTR